MKAAKGLLKFEVSWHPIWSAGLNGEVAVAGDVRAGRGRTKHSCVYLNPPKKCIGSLHIFKRKMQFWSCL